MKYIKILVSELPTYSWECPFCIEQQTDRCFFSREMCNIARQKSCPFLKVITEETAN